MKVFVNHATVVSNIIVTLARICNDRFKLNEVKVSESNTDTVFMCDNIVVLEIEDIDSILDFYKTKLMKILGIDEETFYLLGKFLNNKTYHRTLKILSESKDLTFTRLCCYIKRDIIDFCKD